MLDSIEELDWVLPPLVRVYIRGHIKGVIYVYKYICIYIYIYSTVTEWGQHPKHETSSMRTRISHPLLLLGLKPDSSGVGRGHGMNPKHFPTRFPWAPEYDSTFSQCIPETRY